MKRGLSYIVMAVFCGLCFSSCAKDELAAKAEGDGRAPVRLALSLSGNLPERLTRPRQMVIGILPLRNRGLLWKAMCMY